MFVVFGTKNAILGIRFFPRFSIFLRDKQAVIVSCMRSASHRSLDPIEEDNT